MIPERRSQDLWRKKTIALLPIVLAAIVLFVLLWIPLSSIFRMATHPPALRKSTEWSEQVAQPPIIQVLSQDSPLLDRGIPLRMGLHVENIYELSLRDKTFSADGRIWLEWQEPLDKLMRTQNVKPAQLIDFVNQVEDWNGELVPDTLEPVFGNGQWHQTFRFSQRFYVHRIDLHRFPFNDLNLRITVQAAPAYSKPDGRALLLLPVKNQSGIIGEYASLEGYQLESAQLISQLRTYRTDYGLMHPVKSSQVEAELIFHHRFWPAFVSDVLPLAIVLLVVLISPYLEGSLGDVRIAIPSTALLTLVFLQQGYHSELPPSPYLTYLDRLYAISYLVCLSLFVLFAWSSNVYERTPVEQRDALVRRLDIYDRNFQLVSLALLMVVSIEAWLY